MTKSLTIFEESSNSEVHNTRWQRYLIIGAVANAVIWGSALLCLKLTPPTYTSRSAITLPGAASAVNVNLPSIGQASYQNSSPYASNTQDPREDYKFIAQSEPVLRAAATQLNMSLAKFGRPQLKLVNNTTVMTIDFKGASPEEAQNKSLAFYQVFENKLHELRNQEILRRDLGFQSALAYSQKKLEIAQKRLSDYKAHSGLNSNDQINFLSSNIEDLRKKQAEMTALQQQASSRLKQLSASLNLSEQQAVNAFALQTDQIFQQNLKDYSEANASLVILSSKFSPAHPKVLAEKAKENAAQKALLTRSQVVLGRPVSLATIQQFNLGSISGSARENLFQQLVTVHAEKQGLQAQAQATNQQIVLLQNRLKNQAQQESTLDALKRDMEVAEAVFSSSLTRLDMGKSNVFGSYPLIQTVTKPTLPITHSSPKTEFVLLGAALGSVFFSTALVSAWLRKSKILMLEQKQAIELGEHKNNDLVFHEKNIGSHSL